MNIAREWSPILMRIDAVKFHPAVISFAPCDITSVIHSELVFIYFYLLFIGWCVWNYNLILAKNLFYFSNIYLQQYTKQTRSQNA